MLRIASLHVYPIKSLAGIALSVSKVGPRGLDHDRRWMLVDERGVFLSQRSDARMTRFGVQFADAGMVVTGADGESLLVPFYDREGKDASRFGKVQVKVWESECEAIEYGQDVTEWFSQRLERPARLVWMPEDFQRATDSRFSQPGDHVGFADAFPVLVTSAASLDDLNQRLEQPIPMNRFRPNIVLEGATPYLEDEIESFQLGGVTYRAAKKCGRCRVTCTDQNTGEVSEEPLRTLAKYRREGNTVFFGQYFIPETKGSLAVGETVEAPKFYASRGERE
jgi:uncharacterized protein